MIWRCMKSPYAVSMCLVSSCQLTGQSGSALSLDFHQFGRFSKAARMRAKRHHPPSQSRRALSTDRGSGWGPGAELMRHQ